jgi:hypothetical protein
MGLFNFGKSKNTSQNTAGQTVQFGRYTDRNKTKEQHIHWDNSVKYFQQSEHLKGIEELLYYIRDISQNNISVAVSPGKIEFSITQGSKTFHGKAENGIIEAEARIARFDSPPVPVMRKLLALNYALRYCWCGIKDDYLGIFFSSSFENASSWKLYSSLREMALNADKQTTCLWTNLNRWNPLIRKKIFLLIRKSSK